MWVRGGAALVGLEGKVLAYDKDPTRVERLKRNLAAAGAGNVEAHVANFTALDLTDPEFSDVKALLLDPSCRSALPPRHATGITPHLFVFVLPVFLTRRSRRSLAPRGGLTCSSARCHTHGGLWLGARSSSRPSGPEGDIKS